MKIYTVDGTTGEWEDRRNWIAKAFTKRDKAVAFCEKLNAIAQLPMEYSVIEAKLQKFDKQAVADYTVVYTVNELKVYEQIDGLYDDEAEEDADA